MSGESGGAAAAGGVTYQARVAAWATARILAEERASGFWGFSSRSLVALYCETGGGVDDLLLVTSDAGQLFIQAKRRIDLERGESSELASFVAQCIRQQSAGRSGVGSSDAGVGRPLDRRRDRLVLVTSPAASSGVRVHLRAVLERGRELPAAEPLDALATNKDERWAREVVLAHLHRAWDQEHGSPPSVRQLRDVLALMQVEVLDVEPGGVGEREAQTLLGPGVLSDPSQRATAWSTLVDFCADLMRRRSGTDRWGLQQVLTDIGVVVDPAQSYEADIHRLRMRTTATRQRLVHLATIPAAGVEVRIDRPATEQLARPPLLGLDRLQGWLDQRGLSAHGHSHQRVDARRQTDLERLARLRGPALDPAFVQVMTARARTGSQLAANEARFGGLPEVRQFAHQLRGDQQHQVQQLQSWQQTAGNR